MKENLNKITILDRVLNSYLLAIKNLSDSESLKKGLDIILMRLFKDFSINNNPSFIYCHYKMDNKVLQDMPNWMKVDLIKDRMLSFPISIGTNEPFSILIKTDHISRPLAEKFLQSLIFDIAHQNKNGDVLFKCVDKKKNGLSYGSLIGLIDKNKLFGKKIYKSESDITELINNLDEDATKNIAKLEGKYSSVYEYNNVNKNKIPISVVSFCDVDEFGYGNTIKQLFGVINNSVNTGISTIFLSENENTEINKVLDKHSLVFEFVDNFPYILNNDFKLQLNIEDNFTNIDIEKLKVKLNRVESIDTRFNSFYDIDSYNYFSLDSTNKLVIPFAFDNNKQIVNLEIGGEAPPHALLSGSTGSGKSVLLHTIIEQTMLNYHPDDVEIWAIDYKAVEFGCYVSNKPHHITVIGQDNSEDFSLSLIDLIQKEYNRRKNLFVQKNTKDLEAYRKLCGKRSMSRILIVIDEFHNLTQAIQNYNGEKNYKIILENLLREMRAMGMSFFFCSQTIAAGLNGLTEAARNQIGCRLSMKHEDISEIRETLSLSLNSDVNLENIKNLQKGQVIYKKAITVRTENGKAYEFMKLNVLYIPDETRSSIICNVNSRLNGYYNERKEIICKNSDRYCVIDKERHPISKFIKNSNFLDTEFLTIFPGAPTTLEDSFAIELDEEAGNNLLIIGENDNLRESIIFHTVLGLLMDTSNMVIVSILDTENSDNRRLYSELKQLKSERLLINYGFKQVTSLLKTLKKITPFSNGKAVYIWYGFNKLKNLVFLNEQEAELPETQTFNPENYNPLAAMQNALAQVNGKETSKLADENKENLHFEDYKMILKQLAEYGPENNRYNVSIYNTLKGMKKAGIIKLDDYDYRIGLQMSTDDSYDLFGSSSFITKANDKTAVFYNGSKTPRTIRPYLMPNDLYIKKFNMNLEKENE